MGHLNVLQIYDYMELGGAESHIITLSKALIDRGHSVHVVSTYGPSVNLLKNTGIHFHELNISRKDQYIENSIKLLRIIENEDIDIIHVHPFQSQVVTSLVRLFIDIPVVTTIHGAYSTPSVQGLDSFFDHFVFVSKESLEFHLENKYISSQDQCGVIPNSVPIELSEGNMSINEPLHVTYISRLDSDKWPSILFFLSSLKELVEHMEVKVTIIGRGNRLREVKKLSKDINESLENHCITIVEGSTDIPHHIKNSDVIVGVGRVLLEAIAMGKLALCIGNKHYVGVISKEKLLNIAEVNFTDRNTNQLFSPEWFIEDLVGIKKNPEDALRIASETKSLLKKHFDINQSAEKHERIYQSIINHKHLRKQQQIYNFIEFNKDFDIIVDFIYFLENRSKWGSYLLEGAKPETLLICPDFFNDQDMWKEILSFLFKSNYVKENFTVVIRISNIFQDRLDSIIQVIEDKVADFNDGEIPDMLLDCNDHDPLTELLFLTEINYFITTRENQEREIFKCKLTEGQVIYDIENFLEDK